MTKLATPEIGHNSGFAAPSLVRLVERIERLEEEQAALAEDKKEVYAEAKGEGFDTKVIRQCIRLRKMDPTARKENESVLDLYMAALSKHDHDETQKSLEEGE